MLKYGTQMKQIRHDETNAECYANNTESHFPFSESRFPFSVSRFLNSDFRFLNAEYGRQYPVSRFLCSTSRSKRRAGTTIATRARSFFRERKKIRPENDTSR